MRHELTISNEYGQVVHRRLYEDCKTVSIEGDYRDTEAGLDVDLFGFYSGRGFISCKKTESFVVEMDGDSVLKKDWPTTPIKVGDIINTPFCEESRVIEIFRSGERFARVKLAFNGKDKRLTREFFYEDGRCCEAVYHNSDSTEKITSKYYDEEYFLVERNVIKEDCPRGKPRTSRATYLIPKTAKDVGEGKYIISVECDNFDYIVEANIFFGEGETATLVRETSRAKSAKSH